MQLANAKRVAAKLWAALRRYEPDFLSDVVVGHERELFAVVLGHNKSLRTRSKRCLTKSR